MLLVCEVSRRPEMAKKDPIDSIFDGDDLDEPTSEHDPVDSILERVNFEDVDEETGDTGDVFPKKFVPPNRAVVAVVTRDEVIRDWMDVHLRPAVAKEGYELNVKPVRDVAVAARVVIMDVDPSTDAYAHQDYDRLLTAKRARGWTKDVIAVFGRRERYRMFPRGNYPGLLFFCLDPEHLEYKYPDLTTDGVITMKGPTLFNFCDMPDVICQKLRAYLDELGEGTSRIRRRGKE
jgi:hypothetical protein